MVGKRRKRAGDEFLEIEVNNSTILMHQDQVRWEISFHRINCTFVQRSYTVELSLRKEFNFLLIDYTFSFLSSTLGKCSSWNSSVDKYRGSMVKNSLYCFWFLFSDYKSHEVDKMAHSAEYILVNRRQLLFWVSLSSSALWLRNDSGCTVEVHFDLACEQPRRELLLCWECRLRNLRLDGLGDLVQAELLISPVQAM